MVPGGELVESVARTTVSRLQGCIQEGSSEGSAGEEFSESVRAWLLSMAVQLIQPALFQNFVMLTSCVLKQEKWMVGLV